MAIRIDDNPKTISDRTHSHEWGLSNAEPRLGVSVCECWDDLVDYFSDATPENDGGRVQPWHIADSYVVTVEGEESPDDDHDAGEAGDPFLVVDATTVDAQKITADEVAELVWGGRETDSARHLVTRLEEMVEEFSRHESEQALGLDRSESYELGRLFRDADGSYVVGDEINGVVVAWNDDVEEYQTVPLAEIR